MKVFLLLILAFVTSTLFKNTSLKNVLSVQTANEPSTTQQPTNIVEPTITITPFPRPTSTTGSSSININSSVHIVNNGTGQSGKVQISVQGADWTYPGSSDDSAATVTDWFVNKIKSSGMSTTSFVKTNANDHILNCLAAGGVKIQISQNSDANCQW